MPTLNPNEYAYLWSPTRQMLDRAGKPLVNGYVMLDQHGTPGVEALSYSDWNGTLNARRILLDSLGRASAIVANDKLYDMYVYNRYNVLVWSALGVNCNGEGSGETPLRFTSSDGSIIITRTNNTVDLVVHSEESTQGSATGNGADSNGVIQFDTVSGNVTVVSAGSLSVSAGKLYHITMQLEFGLTPSAPSYVDCRVVDSENESHKFLIDASSTFQLVDLSWDLKATKEFVRFAVEIPQYATLTSAVLYIHAVSAVVNGSGGGSGGEQADWEETDPDSPAFIKHKPDLSVYALKTEIPDVPDIPTPTASNEGNILSVDNQGNPVWTEPQTYSQEQADWDQTDSSEVSYIKNKPDLSIYAESSELAQVAFSGSYNDLSNKPSIPAAQVQSNWSEADTSAPSYIQNKPDLSVYALASSLATVATSGSYNDLSDKPTIPPAQVQSDWNQTNSSAVDYIKNKPTLFSGNYNDLTNKPDLSVYALSSDLAAVATSGDYNDLSNKPTIPAAQVNSDWNAVSGVAQILNKPDLSVYALSSSLATVATSGDYNDLTNKPTIPAAQIQSDWSQTNSSALDYIKNKPDLSVYALASSLASVATSGDYNDLTNKPSIPAAQVQSDYAQTDSSAVDYIKNKPDLSVYALSSSLATVATSGDYNDLSNKPTIPAAQVNSDWNAVSGVAQILNKPDLSVYALASSLATVATSGDYNDLTNKPSIPTKTSDLNNDSGFITSSDVPANQVQSDWTESDTTDPAYIQNKPTQVGLVAGTNINLVEDNVNNTLTINATAAPQQQADWNQSNSSAVDYIKNKPDLSVYALATDLPTFVEGQNIHISTSGTNVTISADDTTYTAGTGIDINNNVISVDTDDVKIDYWHGGSNTALASGTDLNANVSATAYRGENIYVSGGAITLKPGTYAVNAFVKVNNTNTTLDDDSYKLSFSGGITGGNPTIAYNFDNSFRHEEVVEVSFLTVNLGSTDAALVLTTDALSVLSGVSVTLTYAQVYCLSGIVGASGSGGGGSAVITLSSTDHSVTITESTVGDVKNFNLSVPVQSQADWNQNNSSALDYIKNKPNLSVYALSANLATVATSGSYNDLSNKPVIPAAPVQSNWTESNTSSLAYILNKPDLTAYALKSELATVATSGSYADLSNKPDLSVYALSSSLATVATSGDYDDLINKPVIPTQVQANWTESDTTDPSYIENKPDEYTLAAGTNVTITADNVLKTLTISATGGGGSQVQANWTESDTSDPSYIQNKPDLSVYALSSSLATVATSGDYDDLTNKPTIVAPVQSNWNESDSSSLAYILNKPTLFSGNYNDLTNKPDLSVYALSSSLATVATSGAYSDLSGLPTISNVPAVTSSDDGKVLKASYSGGVGSYSWETGGGTQQQADWTESDTTDPSYIQNKPSEYTLVAGSNITMTTSGSNVTIAADDQLPASTSQDSGKVLTVDSSGNPGWATAGSGSQVQSNWNETDTSSAAYIQNKPTIPEAPVQSNWNESNTSSLAYIQNKPSVLKYEALYTNNNGLNFTSSTSMTLSKAITNFDYIEVFYSILYTPSSTTHSYFGSLRFKPDSSKKIAITSLLPTRMTSSTDTPFWACSLLLESNDNKIWTATKANSVYRITTASSSPIKSLSAGDIFYIYKVIGYKL